MTTIRYGFGTTLRDVTFEDAVRRVKRALEAEPDIGLLLPCNVTVEQQGEGQVRVAIADPKAMFAGKESV